RAHQTVRTPHTHTPPPQGISQLQIYLEHLAQIEEATLRQHECIEGLRERQLQIKEKKLNELIKAQKLKEQQHKKREEVADSLSGMDQKCLPVFQPQKDILTFLENFELSVKELDVDESLWLGLLHTQ
ncbi:hypothetical protein JRQ81_017628, partial [Phrynocephalus forsythii]